MIPNPKEDPNDKYAFISDNEEGSDVLNPVAEELLARCDQLLEEVESFQRQLRHNKVEKTVEMRLFLNQVKAEQHCIRGLCLEGPESSKSKHGVKACNLPYIEALWNAAKGTVSITALCKTFTIVEEAVPVFDGRRGKRNKTSVMVDVVAQNGLQWIKVSLLTERRLLFEIAKAGWGEGYSTEEDADVLESSNTAPNLETSTLPLTTLAASLVRAASQTRIQYLHPSIHLILPNLYPTETTTEINTFITTLTDLGVHVQTGASDTLFSPRSIPDLVEDLSKPTKRHNTPITQTLNIDTTILLALVSDIACTASVPPEPRFHAAILRQLEQEADSAMLPNHLWPVLSGKDLVCSPSARARFNEIVGIVGSDLERARAALLVDGGAEMNGKKRCEAFQELCVHALPQEGLKLPVRTLEEDYYVEDADAAPSEAFRRVLGKLSSVNRSVFMLGWQRDITTVSSNRSVVKIIEGLVLNDEKGPDVYVIETARSLVGKARKIQV